MDALTHIAVVSASLCLAACLLILSGRQLARLLDAFIRLPADATVIGTWHRTGAYEDVVRVGWENDGWRFPLGSHLCDHLWAYTWGKVRPQLKNASNDVESVYRRVNPDDWDDNGIPNEDDDEPYCRVADNARFGPNQGLSFTANIQVVEPDGIEARNPRCCSYDVRAGRAGWVGLWQEFYVCPLDVSFSNGVPCGRSK